VQDYRSSSDYTKIAQIIDQYQAKYSKDLGHIKPMNNNLTYLKEQLAQNILTIYKRVEDQAEIGDFKE